MIWFQKLYLFSFHHMLDRCGQIKENKPILFLDDLSDLMFQETEYTW